MAESKPADQSSAQKTESKPTEAPKSQASADPGKGLADELKTAHQSRITVPGRDGVDARLDNRSVQELEAPPTYGPDDPKPQSVDGPDLAGQAEHTREVLAKRKKG